MKEMRVLGSTIKKLADERSMTAEDLGHVVHCAPQRIFQLYKGRLFLSFNQLLAVAEAFHISVDELLEGDKPYYEKNVVHCMGSFSEEAREQVLDMIDDYLDLYDAAQEEDA